MTYEQIIERYQDAINITMEHEVTFRLQKDKLLMNKQSNMEMFKMTEKQFDEFLLSVARIEQTFFLHSQLLQRLQAVILSRN